VALMGLVVAVTAILNLDTSVWFLTPVLVHAARARGADERPFLYGSVMMANAASLILPGSNLTNLVVLAHEHVAGATFAARIWPAWVAAVLVTGVVVRLSFASSADPEHELPAAPDWQLGLGALGIVAAGTLVLVLKAPALPVLALGVLLVLVRRSPWRDVRRAASPLVLGSLFALAVVLGTIARTTGWFQHVVEAHARWTVAALAAGVSVITNNLPAAVLLASHQPTHARALLIGLNLGPNLFVTGSLSAYLWWRAAQTVAAPRSVKTYAGIGVVVVPLSMAAALIALQLLSNG
jgi:arsenical pump membrane protein